MSGEKILDISWGTIVKIGLAIVFFYLIYAVRDVLIWFVFALVISVLFNPAIDFLQKRKIPRVAGAAFVYVAVFGVLGLVIYLMVPIFTSEIVDFSLSFSDYFERVSPLLEKLGFKPFDSIDDFFGSFGKTLEAMAANVFNALFAVFGGVFSGLFVIATAFFLSLEERVAERALTFLFPKKYESTVLYIWQRCQKKVAGWFGARLIACLFVGIASYIVFLLFGVKYPFTLALFAGVFNFVPYIGPLVTGIFLVLLVAPLNHNILKTIFVLITFVIIQQIEGSILSPLLLKKIVGLPPALVIVSLVVGGKLWGILGAALIVPLAGILFEFLKEFLEKRKMREIV